MRLLLVAVLCCLLTATACMRGQRRRPAPALAPAAEPESVATAPGKPRILFVTQSIGYTHAVVKREAPDELSLAERQFVAAMGERWDVHAIQDCAAFDWDELALYDAVVFYTTGEVPIPESGRRNLLRYVANGGGFAGIHPATDTLYEWPAYGELVGGYFDGHPWHQKVRVKVENKDHPSTQHLGGGFEITDEIYQFKAWDRKRLQVLLSIDNESIDTEKKGVKRKDKDFAVAWCKPYGYGRVFYTSLGHRPEVWKDERYLKHLEAGVVWTMREQHQSTPLEPDRTEILLGERPAAGWKQAGPGRFVVDEHGVATAEGGMGLWWYAKEAYSDFILSLEFKQPKLEANSGVFVRFPRGNDDPWRPVHEGYEIQIHGDKPSKHATGAVYSFQAPTHVPIRPAGQWNEMQIVCRGQSYTVLLNGERVNEFQGERSLVGHVGIQNHGHADDAVSYRNIRIRRLSTARELVDSAFEGER